MPREEDIPFYSIIKETFGSVLKEYGFKLQSEAIWNGMGEDVITAKKGDIELNFYLGVSQLFYYCSVGIELSGELGEKATSNPKFSTVHYQMIE